MEHVFRETLKELENGKSCVLATVINTEGSTPQKAGAKLLIREDGGDTGSGTSLKPEKKQIIKVWERVHRKHALAGE